ncbi:MAG: DUF3987 domain-containing protein [Bacteroidales bacterium]|nr:DUF3987 domain-containing protein [Bacteroidales bacterium]
MSGQVFNPDDWNSAPVEKVPAALSPAVASSSNLPAILALVGAVEASGIDITPTYSDWLSIAFALVSELGEDGRSIFQRLSRFNPHYEYEETDRQYSHCLNDGSREITIASLFHIAHLHGVRWEQPRAPQKPSPKSSSSHSQFEDGEDLRMSKSVKIGTFSQSVREQLPDILKRVVADSVSDVDADLLILGSLTVFSACLPNVYGVYDRREVFSNLFLYVTARASAGKGRLSLCRHLVAPIHRELREQYRKSMEKYKQDQLQYVLNKKKGEATEPQEPPFLTLFIPANSTATVVYQTLSQNDGVGLLFETEGDTLANAFNSDLGNYSDGFRKAFHHETISYLRKKDREYVEITKPKFSAILSGTPQQVFNLIPSAENGLFSRFIFYVMPTEIVWHDMFSADNDTTADDLFKEIGRDFCQFHKMLSAQYIRFTLTTDQQRQFNAFFTQTQEEYAALFGDDIIASVRRLGLILFRFAMILTVLRQMDDGAFPLPSGNEEGHRPESILVCADADFATALAMVKVLLQHSAAVFQTLPRHDFYKPRGHRNTNDRRQAFFAALPDVFDRAAYLKAAASLSVSEKTAERYISDLCKAGLLEHPAIDNYKKKTQ